MYTEKNAKTTLKGIADSYKDSRSLDNRLGMYQADSTARKIINRVKNTELRENLNDFYEMEKAR